MASRSVAICCVILCVPAVALAQVQISEIMYNPKGSDTGREWIELYNAGSSDAALVGGSGKGSWRIGDTSNHTLVDPASGTGRGSLVIPGSGYLVIASDPTEFISGEYAGGVYSVIKSSISLNNTGITVSLIDGSGNVVDSSAYTKDQGANDDGASLQRQSSGAWIAGLPTPGIANTTATYILPDTTSTTDSTSSTTTSTSNTTVTPTTAQASVSSYVPPPSPTLFVDGGSDRAVIVGADTEFDGRAYNKEREPVDRVRYMWNFGDGTTAEGPAVLHHYEYPGRYVVVLTVAEDKQAQSDYFTVTAEPAKLSFSANADGSVSIGNLAGRDLDLSGWIIRSVGQRFMLPDHSIVLAGATLRIAQRTLGFFSGVDTELDYPNGARALASGSASETAAATSSIPVVLPTKTSAASPTPEKSKTSEKTPAIEAAPEQRVDDITADASGTAQVAGAAAAFGGGMWWLGAVTLAALAGGAMLFIRSQRSGEWDIEEIDIGKEGGQ